jgi:glycosyltransferase involved in cell wall biosynthesis
MRILYVVNDLNHYSADQQLTLLALGLPRDQFDVHVCCLRSTGELESDLTAAGVGPMHVAQRWPLDPLAWWRLERLVRRLRPDVIHTGGSGPGPDGALASLFGGGAKWVASQPTVGRLGWHQLPIARFMAAKARAMVVPRKALSDYFIRRGWPAGKMVVIAPGIAPMPARSDAQDELADELGLPRNVHLIGLAGRLEVDQGWKEVVWSLDILRCLRDDIHVVVIGDGRQRSQLERFARLCTLDSHVHFLGRRQDVLQLLPQFNHVWQGPGSGEFALAVGEALAAGVPVVASDTTGNRELVIHDQTGFLVPTGARARRAHYANRLINDPPLRARLGEAGRLRTTSHWNMEQLVARHVDLYRRIVDR